MKVGIIGAGIGGLASAVRLAAAGHQVEVFEASVGPGGKLSEIREAGYRFDAGPSLFTLPQLVDELFDLAGENPRDHFRYQRLPVNCHYFYPDGTFLRAFDDREQFLAELSTKTKEPAKNLERAIAQSARLYRYLSELFMYRSLHDPKTFFNKAAFRAYANLHRLGFFQTMDGANQRMFKDPRIVQLFNRYATYNGSSPYLTPATMNIIPHLELSMGAYFPEGGMFAITQAIFELAKRKGVIFHFNSPAEEIVMQSKKVTGIRVNGVVHSFDRVVSNLDVVNSYKRLMPGVKAPEMLLSQPKSSSALIFYWGVKRQFDQLDLHNIFFSVDYQTEFDHLFRHKTVYHDPTVYVNITSKYTDEDAPSGSENWFTMINVPNNTGQDWDQIIAEARQNILAKLKREWGMDVAPYIEVEQVLDPRTIESKTGSALGALYGNSSNNLFAAFLRHSNVSKRVKGLYFCGGSVHPGGGIPMCLSSARLVAKYFR